ncbi:general transcription factor IIF subunit 1-like [Ylistrum balloti]|uniref:general transcription factor IIF subunit 1-like n=1 Tax=Ylistrum balloti TaxID=509963 RepID=UPI002905DF77|nr:general transcription factor IIF subunit 1-like [Ylistrum balloti]
MMKFSSGANIDFNKLSQEQTPVRMERENNLKEYKTAHGIDMMPKFGAGSEFGREQKETARRKKYGIMMKRYDPGNQPWLMKVGKTKEAKKYKGVREGTIAENTSYYIFTQCPDGAFEAFPIEEWYNFSPMVQYKYLNSEEAEEEFNRRDKTLNYFSIMVRKRIKNDEEGDNVKLEEGEKVKEKSRKTKKQGFQLTDLDDEDDEDDDDYDDEDENKDDEKPKKKTKKAAKPKKTAKHNSDDEAVEESDEGDFDDRELDYITDSDSSLSETGDREKGDLYQEKGVDEERGLKKLLDSDESSEDEEEKKKQEEKEKEEAEKNEKKKKEGSDSDSSSSSSDSDSDIDKDEKISSAIFMQKKEKRLSPVPRAGTPVDSEDKSSLKRKLETETQASKKMRTDSPSLGAHGSSSGGITEESIRRYLMRKPMTTKELLHKFKSKRVDMTKDAMMSAIATLLKKISPKKEMVKNVMYLSLKKDG